MKTFTVSLFGIPIVEVRVECDCPPPEEQPPRLHASGGGQFERDFGFDT